jgi:hypothetical protein
MFNILAAVIGLTAFSAMVTPLPTVLAGPLTGAAGTER